MKLFKPGFLIAMLTFAHFIASAQQDKDTHIPKWVSDKGYWVVKGNVNTPLDNTILFYNNDHVLVYKESLTGVKLNPDKRKVKMKLKQVLESSITAWESKSERGEEMARVRNIL